jgi:hypothetical protein
MRKLEEPSKVPLKQFGNKGWGVKRLIKELDLQSDFKGCYVMFEKTEPVYVGISKCVISRLIQHVRGNTHFAATLAYRIAKKEFPHKLSREEAMKDPTFIDLFTSAKERIKGMHVIFVEIENPLELYIFEPYCAMKFKTATMECKADELNTFETH